MLISHKRVNNAEYLWDKLSHGSTEFECSEIMPGGWNSVHGDAVATSDEAETLRGLMHAILEMLDSGFIQAKMRGEIPNVEPSQSEE